MDKICVKITIPPVDPSRVLYMKSMRTMDELLDYVRAVNRELYKLQKAGTDLSDAMSEAKAPLLALMGKHFAGSSVVLREDFLPAPGLPKRELRPKDWHFRRCYPSRVQKKWVKRFGRDEQTHMYIFGNKIFVSRKLWNLMMPKDRNVQI